jgi:hypothetical protein
MAMRINYGQLARQMMIERTESGVSAINPPALPKGYEPIGAPQPLSPDPEAWWMCFTQNVKHDVPGMLIYSDDEVVTFLCSQEAVCALFGLLDHLMDLAADCPPSFTDAHTDEMYTLWHAWGQMQEPQPEEERPCVKCWYEQHPGVQFPPEKSSSLCGRHRADYGHQHSVGGHDVARA